MQTEFYRFDTQSNSGDYTTYPLKCEDLEGLYERPQNGHKGTFGRVAIVGGSPAMSGAGYFAAKAAYRAGAGLVELFSPEENRVIYQTSLPEALLTIYDAIDPDLGALTDLLSRADSAALGMGLSRGRRCRDFLRIALTYFEKPLVLDADALNELTCADDCWNLLRERKAPTVLTPHLGEAARLGRTTVADIQQNPAAFALWLAKATKSIVVLKDAQTLITDGKQIARNTYGNNGMATGGSGDVLAGVIAAFAVNNPPYRAATLGVLAHALAGDCAKEKCGAHGTMASDILDGLCYVLE